MKVTLLMCMRMRLLLVVPRRDHVWSWVGEVGGWGMLEGSGIG